MRLLTYNVRSLRDDRRALVRVIRACAVDVVCVQESPRYLLPVGQANWLARAVGMRVLAGGGRVAAGPVVLGRAGVEVVAVRDRLLPKTKGLHARGFATAVLRVDGGGPVTVTSCHLSLDPEERLAQFALLPEQARPGEAAVVAGDFNEHPDGPGWQGLASVYRDAHVVAPWGGTFTSVPANPYQRIDAVFVTPDVTVEACGVPQELSAGDLRAATDHLPVLAVLRVPHG